MRLARVLGAIGRGLISAGVVVLLFVAYQLWGTGIQNGQAQSSLGNEFAELVGDEAAADADSLAEAAQASQENIERGGIVDEDVVTSGAASVGEDGATLTEVDLESAAYQEIVAKLYPDEGEPLARIVIPEINVDQIVIEGVSVEDLRKGPGHYPSTPNPGQAGNASIAGHRTTYGAPFHRVDELQPGDDIFVTTAQGTFRYQVKGQTASDGSEVGHLIVNPSDVWVLGQESGENLLTLTACHPKYSARQRIIVQAEMVGEPAPTIPRGEGGEQPTASLVSEEVSSEQDPTSDDIERGVAQDVGAEDGSDVESVISDAVALDDDPSMAAGADDVIGADGAAESETSTETTQAADLADEAVEPVPAAEDEAAAQATLLDEVEAESASDSDPSTTDFGEGLSGDRTRIKPAIFWGAAAMTIWITAGFIGRRINHRVLVYAVGLVPLGLVLWSAFVNVDQALPSY